jgi:hypothetical protein
MDGWSKVFAFLGRHARHAQLGDVITLDFINTDLDPSARAGIELTLETAKELRAALD